MRCSELKGFKNVGQIDCEWISWPAERMVAFQVRLSLAYTESELFDQG